MGTVYEIEGDLITRVTRQVEQIGRLSDLLPSLTTYKPIEVGYLPRDCSYVHVAPTAQDTVEATVIVSQPPQVRRIVFNETHARAERRKAFSLAMPYFVFWFRMHGTPQGRDSMLWAPRHWATLWMRQAPRNIATDMAVRAYMPNTWGDGRVCFGNNPVDANQTLGQYIDGLINTYWTSQFNTDLGVSTPYGSTPRSALNDWTRASAADRDVWRNWDIWRNESPLKTLIEHVDGTVWDTPMPDSTEPVVPQTPRAFTFHSVRQWLLTSLTEEQRARVLWALTQADITPEDPDDDSRDTPERTDTTGLDAERDAGEQPSDGVAEPGDAGDVDGAGPEPDAGAGAPAPDVTTHVLDGPTVHRVASRRNPFLTEPVTIPASDDTPG